MPNCQNPECQKEIPENRKYCNENCLKRYFELKKEQRQQKSSEYKNEHEQGIQTDALLGTNSEWVGQDRAKNTMNIILKICIELCPRAKDALIAYLRYRTGLSWRKIEEDYFRTLSKIGALRVDSENVVTVTEFGKELSTKRFPDEGATNGTA